MFTIKNPTKKAINGHLCDTFSTNPIQLSSTFLWAQFIYYTYVILLSMT